MVLNKLNHLFINIFCLFADFVIEVRTVEGGDKDLRFVHTEVFLDITLHFRSGCSSQCNDRNILANLLDNLADVSVFRTEVVTPFRNTVCLVNRIERDVDILEKVHVLFLGQGFRSNIQQLGLPRDKVFFHFGNFSLVERGVQEMRNATVCTERPDCIHLILHQGNQRGNDDGRAVTHQRRQLVTHRLAASCRHNHKTVLAFQQCLNNLQLITFESVKTEDRFQRLGNGFIRNSLHEEQIYSTIYE